MRLRLIAHFRLLKQFGGEAMYNARTRGPQIVAVGG
jgi:hypothetical protein